MTPEQHQGWEWCWQYALEYKRAPAVYASIMIVKCSKPDFYWYRDLVGEIIPLARLELRYYNHNGIWHWRDPLHGDNRHLLQGPWLVQAYVVRLTKTKEIRGKSIPAEDLIIL